MIMVMETRRKLRFLLLFLLCHLPFSVCFTPLDNYLLNCGSAINASYFNRLFIGDSSESGSIFLSKDRSISLTNQNPSPNSPSIYHTARIFTTGLSYNFNIGKNGTHMVRFHFSPFIAGGFKLASANFSVSVNGNMILKNFHVGDIVVKELILSVDKDIIEITFVPVSNFGFGFVNAIEVFSAPSDLILDYGAKLVKANGNEEFKNISSQVLDTIHRINVGGPKLTPFNDTLWRTWVPDENYLVLKSAAKRVAISHKLNYQKGGANREIAPDNVYMTAQEMNRDNSSSVWFNITWRFPVGSSGVLHFIRLHFCDIVSPAHNLLYFNVYINGYSAYMDINLSALGYHVLASPIYLDFVVESDDSGAVQISVGPSQLSSTLSINAILNGAEIMKMVNIDNLQIETGAEKRSLWILVGSIFGGILFLLLSVMVVLIVLKRRKKKPKSRRAASAGWTPLRVFGGSNSRMSEGTTDASLGSNGYLNMKIPFADVQSATNDFNKDLIIGSGGFGMVYKGVLRDNTKVAVKRCMPGSRQGLPEFQTEITVLSKIRHHHLVSLVGYCDEQSEMILAYEYMENGPLKKHLYGSGLVQPLTWKQRLEICIGSARGLHYLHTGFAQGIIHRDIKSTNILLDEKYVAKVADFGLSRSGPCLNETHVSTGVKGSFGYLDPEYYRRQQLTDKSDVYSFGVVLFEVLCARSAVDPLLAREQVSLAEWALEWQKRGMLEQMIDPHLIGQIKPSSLKKFGETAEKCLAEYGVDRPTMGDVLWNLEYALRLQEAEPRRERQEEEDSNADSSEMQTTRIVPLSYGNIRTEGDDGNGNGSSEINTSQVFSQLINNEGR